MAKQVIISAILTIFSFIFPLSVLAQEGPEIDLSAQETLEAVVSDVLEEKELEVMEKKQLFQKLEVVVTHGSLKGKTVIVENGAIPLANVQKFKTGDQVVITKSKGPEGNDMFFISDFVRRDALLKLFLIFVALTVIVGRMRGLSSLLGMAASFLVIFYFILPRILQGDNPILIAILGSLIIIPLTFYLSHGISRKTTIAIFGTLIALVFTGVLSSLFVEAANLTGFVSDEAGFLQVAKGGLVNIKGLLLAGIIIGALGVLDDVTVSQAAVVEKLKEAAEKITPGELYKKAMSVGHDHIASMVNTLILVYTGASLPLLLLFVNTPHPFVEVVNYEIIANEIIRTLVGSIGLILAVPITTFLACLFNKN